MTQVVVQRQTLLYRFRAKSREGLSIQIQADGTTRGISGYYGAVPEDLLPLSADLSPGGRGFCLRERKNMMISVTTNSPSAAKMISSNGPADPCASGEKFTL
jgi:hypothetical protein